MPAQDGFLWTHGTYQFHTLTTEHGEVPPLEGWARMWKDPLDTEVDSGGGQVCRVGRVLSSGSVVRNACVDAERHGAAGGF